ALAAYSRRVPKLQKRDDAAPKEPVGAAAVPRLPNFSSLPEKDAAESSRAARAAAAMSGGLCQTLRARFPRDLAATFIETPQGQRFSYGDLLAESGRMANALAAAGAQPSDRVMVQAGKSPQVVFLYLACVRAGLVYLPLNSGDPRAEGEYFFADADPRGGVCAPHSPPGVA